jgi:hypothetical protein
MHGTAKCLWAMPFRTKVAPFMIIMAPTVRVSLTSLGLRNVTPWVVPSVHLNFRPGVWLAQSVVG